MTVYRIVYGDLQEAERLGDTYVLFNGDCYLLDSGPLGPLWLWIGSRSSVDERFTASFQANNLRLERGEIPSVISVFEGEEPQEFLNQLVSFLVIDGGVHGFLRKYPTHPTVMLEGVDIGSHLPALYRVDTNVLVELPLSRKSLSSSSVILLDAGIILWVWVGRDALIPDDFSPLEIIKARDPHHPDPEIRWLVEGDEHTRFFEYFRFWEESEE